MTRVLSVLDPRNRRFVQRECPMCGHQQLVVLSRLRDAVICERCDYHIPKKAAA